MNAIPVEITGVPETVGENVKEIVTTDILVTCFGIDQNTEIERAHRDGKRESIINQDISRLILEPI